MWLFTRPHFIIICIQRARLGEKKGLYSPERKRGARIVEVANKLTCSTASRLNCRSCGWVTVTQTAPICVVRACAWTYPSSSSLRTSTGQDASTHTRQLHSSTRAHQVSAPFLSARTIKVRGKARTASSPSVSHSKAAVIPHWSPFHPGPGNHPCVRTSE